MQQLNAENTVVLGVSFDTVAENRAFAEKFDFPYLLRMIHDSSMSRANSIVIPGGKMDLAMQLILTPLIWKLMERRRQWV